MENCIKTRKLVRLRRRRMDVRRHNAVLVEGYSKLAKQEQISTHQAKKGSGGNNNSNMNT